MKASKCLFVSVWTINMDMPDVVAFCRPSSERILEALHVDPASALTVEQEKNKVLKPLVSTSSAMAKLSKAAPGGSLKTPQAEKKETPQERLKRIMSKQLNKQIRKDSAVEMAKKKEQERQRREKITEASRTSHYRRHSHSSSRSPSPPRRYHQSSSRSRSPRRHRSRSRSHSHSDSPRTRSRTRYWRCKSVTHLELLL